VGEVLNKFDDIYSILARYGYTSLFLMDDRDHHQYRGFADYLVFGKIGLKREEDAANEKMLHLLTVTKMRGMAISSKTLFFEFTPSGIKGI